jgi:glycosyltransferase involved in cell wall biosynthesis
VAARVARILRREEIALLHANSLSMSFVSGRAADEAGIPSVGHVRDIQRLSRNRIAELSRNRCVLSVSRATADNLVSQGLSGEAVRVIHNAVDPEVFRPDGPPADLREELLLHEEELLVGCIGQICLRKGQNLLLRAFTRVLETVPEAILLIVGERHSTKAESVEFEEALHRFVEARGIERSVRFLGYRDDVPAVLRSLDVLVHAAHQEPLGRVLLEAAATGVPVVATSVGGTAEIVLHGETGRLVRPGRPGPLARSIARLLRSPDERRAMGRRAREHVREAFSPRAHAASVATLYEELLATPRDRPVATPDSAG